MAKKPNRSRDVITTTVDRELHEAFERSKGLLNMNYGDIFDKAVREVLIQLKSVPIIDQELIRKQSELNKIQEEIRILIELNEQIKAIKIPEITHDNKNNGNSASASPELEQHRIELFEKSKEGAIKLWYKGDINWDSVIARYRFDSRKDAQDWFRTRIEAIEDGI